MITISKKSKKLLEKYNYPYKMDFCTICKDELLQWLDEKGYSLYVYGVHIGSRLWFKCQVEDNLIYCDESIYCTGIQLSYFQCIDNVIKYILGKYEVNERPKIADI